MIKKLIPIIACIAFFGCANGTWHTGSTVADAGLTSATAYLAGDLTKIADQIAQGSDLKTAFVNGSGGALNSLVGIAASSVSPVVSQQIAKWVPPSPEWETFAHDIGAAIQGYVAKHGNTPEALSIALQAGAGILNSY